MDAVDKGQLQMVLRAFEKTKNHDGRKIELGLRRCAEIIFELSQVYVPVATGNLKQSGGVRGNGKVGLAAQYAVVYEARYAIYVHERTDIPHKPPTSSKYVEKAVRERLGVCRSILRRVFRGELN